MVDGTGVHHPIGIGTNGISARALRSNNGQWECLGLTQQFACGLPAYSRPSDSVESKVWFLTRIDLKSTFDMRRGRSVIVVTLQVVV